MSRHKKQIDGCNAICPYCESSYQVEGESYCESGRVEECDECGKKYHYATDFSVDHQTTPDCELNGEEHLMETKYGALFCTVCGACKLITEVTQ